MEQGYNEAIEGWDMKYRPKQEAIERKTVMTVLINNLGDSVPNSSLQIVADAILAAQPKQEAIEKKVSERIAGYIQENVVFQLHLQIKEHEKKIAEQITGYVHEIDSLRITNRELGKKLADLKTDNNKYVGAVKAMMDVSGELIQLRKDKQILLNKIQEQEIEIAALKNKVKYLQDALESA